MVRLGDNGTLAELYAQVTGDAATNALGSFTTAGRGLARGVTSDDPFDALPAVEGSVSSTG